MGMFDTIILSQPMLCECGKMEIKNFQVKCFDNLLFEYRIGDFVTSPFYTGVIEEDYYCNHCKKKVPIWIVVKNSLLYGVYDSLEKAEAESRNPLERMEIMDFYYPYFLKYHQLKGSRIALINSIKEYISYLEKTKENPEYRPRFSNFDFKGLDTIEALKMILEQGEGE